MTVSVCQDFPPVVSACAGRRSALAANHAILLASAAFSSGSSCKLHGTRKPGRRVHPRIDRDEEVHLRDVRRTLRVICVPPWVDEDMVVWIKLTAILYLKAVLIGGSPFLPVLVRSKGITNKFDQIACSRSDRILKWRDAGISRSKHFGTAISECSLNLRDYIAASGYPISLHFDSVWLVAIRRPVAPSSRAGCWHRHSTPR